MVNINLHHWWENVGASLFLEALGSLEFPWQQSANIKTKHQTLIHIYKDAERKTYIWEMFHLTLHLGV